MPRAKQKEYEKVIERFVGIYYKHKKAMNLTDEEISYRIGFKRIALSNRTNRKVGLLLEDLYKIGDGLHFTKDEYEYIFFGFN